MHGKRAARPSAYGLHPIWVPAFHRQRAGIEIVRFARMLLSNEIL
jgi:hypothetical protein